MNVVSIVGGLGNQMFQYAFGLLLPAPVRYDLSWFQQQEDGPNRRDFGLRALNCTPEILPEEELTALLRMPVTFVDLSSYQRAELDMMVMRECRHNIIANSTYSWWGAWLNENPSKIVIAPKGKFSADQQELVCNDWVQI